MMDNKNIIIDVENTSISSKPATSIPIKQEFNIHQYSLDYWANKKPKFIQCYNVGKNRGNIATKHITTSNVITEFIQYFNQTLIYIYNNNDKTTEKLQNCLNILNSVAKIISIDIENNKTIEVEEFIAGMQGIVNSFTEKTLG
jgi:hypothetical protein